MSPDTIFWFRRDLRLDDNHGLFKALSDSKSVLPIFIFDPTILEKIQDKKDPRVSYIHQTIATLKKQLQEVGGDIQVFFDTPENVFKELFNTYSIGGVYLNRDYEPYARVRDEKIETLCLGNNVSFKSYKDHVFFEPGEVTKDNGEPYVVYTPYSKKALSCLAEEGLPEMYPSRELLSNICTHSFQEVSLKSMGFHESDIAVPSHVFSQELARTYNATRNFPALENSTSRLGMYLRFGTVSIRQLLHESFNLSDITFVKELLWREFFQTLIWFYPNTPKNEFKKQYAAIQWRNNKAEFELWKAGETGYPLVDAGMRELAKTGMMHNRVRMTAASFLIKHLLVDWRWGERYFAEKLLDYELASNVGNWQWVCGSGADASPYFRVFNPYLQQKKFDPDFEYIKKWIPEYGTDEYPEPMVEHAFARNRCLEVFKTALKKDETLPDNVIK